MVIYLLYLRSFIDEFLNIIFAKAAVTSVVDLADERNGFSFGHANDPDLFGSAARPLRRMLDSEQDRAERCHRRASTAGAAIVVSYVSNYRCGSSFSTYDFYFLFFFLKVF